MAQLGISVSFPVLIASDYVFYMLIPKSKALLFPSSIPIYNNPNIHYMPIGSLFYICTSGPRIKRRKQRGSKKVSYSSGTNQVETARQVILDPTCLRLPAPARDP